MSLKQEIKDHLRATEETERAQMGSDGPTIAKDGFRIIASTPPPEKTDPRNLRWPYWGCRKRRRI